jgi:phospholipase C
MTWHGWAQIALFALLVSASVKPLGGYIVRVLGGRRTDALPTSQFSRRGYVDHKVGDTTSVLAFIVAGYGLQPLQPRDAEAYPMLDRLDFSEKPREPAFS